MFFSCFVQGGANQNFGLAARYPEIRSFEIGGPSEGFSVLILIKASIPKQILAFLFRPEMFRIVCPESPVFLPVQQKTRF